ncbi:DUF1501 domain-containing protein [Aquabacterium sp.]|uniref:DUF1501 domain-containing protein n=1 Tax=Aquabacterium sp. TaxID=1872578 RepID=UPI0027BAFDF7|nr:DUF1501 domain-containing protein [Aquabacterium sp.]
MNPSNRRQFLQRVAALSGMGAAAPLGLSLSALTEAAAQSAGSGSYRALVCIVLNGGNDAFNTVLATDATSWDHYNTHRKPADGSAGIALPAPGIAANGAAARSDPARLGGVLPISHQGRSVHAGRNFALHPALSNVQSLHEAGRIAVLANVGPLTRPTTKADFANATVSKPAKLFSHNDQQSTWQSFNAEGADKGWGGLMGDKLMGGNGAGRSASEAGIIQRSFTCMSPGSASVWLAGQTVLPYQSSTTGILGLGSAGKVYGSSALHGSMAAIMGKLQSDGSHWVPARNLLHSDHQKVVQRALQASDLLSANLAAGGSAPWATPAGAASYNAYNDDLLKYTSVIDGTRKTNHLAMQLQMVARLIATNAAANLGITRQFFMVNLGGFDTHDDQIRNHGERLTQLNHAMAYFDAVLGSMPAGDLRAQVTTFTISEFGRTFTSNGDGSDHGWGGHQFIMGGAVKGTEVYGTFPAYSTANSSGVFSSPDQIQNGSLIPSTSVDQYAYTLGKWMGVSQADLGSILPHLSQFDSSVHDLGFMKA